MLTELFIHKPVVAHHPLATWTHCLQQRDVSQRLSIGRPTTTVPRLICTDNLTTLLEKNATVASWGRTDHRWAPPRTLPPTRNMGSARVFGGQVLSPPVWFSPFRAHPEGDREPRFAHEMPKERESFSSSPLPVILFHTCEMSRQSLYSHRMQKNTSFVGLSPCIPPFSFWKSLSVLFLIYQQGASLLHGRAQSQ